MAQIFKTFISGIVASGTLPLILIVFLVIVGVPIIKYLINSAFYKKTDYYDKKRTPFLRFYFDKGTYGEYLTYKYLRSYEQDGAKFLYNCYLPKDDGETTEVDVMMIHSSGIYVFESKNYSGWIFGSENQKNWTQSLPQGRGSHKEQFLNPIMQNKLHIKWLEKQIGENRPIHSIVVFSERCELKKVEVTGDSVKVIKRYDVLETVKDIAATKGTELTESEIESIYNKLYPFTQVDDDLKAKHIQDIKSNHEGDSDTTETENVVESANIDTNSTQVEPLICPRCGGKLVKRVSSKGAYAGREFFGCSNFPKCRYTKDI